MKKIALCLHGQPRGVDIAIEYQNKNLINREDISVDVFFHTWDYSDKINGINQKLLNFYNPKGFFFEAPPSTQISQKYENGNGNAYRNYSHYHSVYECDKLRRNYEKIKNIEYEWIVCTRFDVALNVVLNFNDMDSSKVYQSDFDRSLYESNGFKVQNPVLACGNGNNIQKYCSMIENLDVLYENTNKDIDGHAIFGANIKMKGLSDNMQHLEMNHPFPPRGRDASPNSFVRDDFDMFNSLSK